MAIYVDNARIKWRGRLWCHLVADSLEELHEFAQKLGLRKNWFQRAASYPHYDVTIEIRQMAISMGAIEGNRLEIMTCARGLKTELLQNKVCMQPKQLSFFEYSWS